MFDEKLGRALNFNEEDLNANRSGIMTEPQRQSLWGHIILMLTLFPIIFWGLLIAGTMLFSTLQGMGEDMSRSMRFFGGLAVLIAIGVGGLGYWLQLIQTWREGKVKTIEGHISFVRVSRSGGRWRHSIEVEEDGFQIDERVLPLLTEGDYYRFYFSVGSNKLLFAERVDQ